MAVRAADALSEEVERNARDRREYAILTETRLLDRIRNLEITAKPNLHSRFTAFKASGRTHAPTASRLIDDDDLLALWAVML